jgi:hypothetical protein
MIFNLTLPKFALIGILNRVPTLTAIIKYPIIQVIIVPHKNAIKNPQNVP